MINIKDYKGVTLVALVITIIILLILSTITLTLVLGDNGIIKKAQTAREQTNISQAEETIKTLLADLQVSKNGQASINDIQELESNEISIIPNSGTTVDIEYNKQYIFTIDSNFHLSNPRKYSENTVHKIQPELFFDDFER